LSRNGCDRSSPARDVAPPGAKTYQCPGAFPVTIWISGDHKWPAQDLIGSHTAADWVFGF
jgi:hypothetical protein